MRSWRRVALAAALVCSAGCARSDAGRNAPCGGDYMLPSRTTQDLVTYADEVSVVEVVSQKVIGYDIPNDGLEPEHYRNVTIQVVDTVWAAPQGRAVPDEVTFNTGGWVGGGPVPVCDQPTLRVGDHYLVGVVEYSKGRWGLMSGPFVLTVDEEGAVHGVARDAPLSQHDGQTPAEVGAALDEVKPDPAAAPYVDQPGGLRYR